MMKAVIIGIISVVVLGGVIGGAVYMASRSNDESEEGSVISGDTIPLAPYEEQPTDESTATTAKLAGTKLTDFQPVAGAVTELVIEDKVEGNGETAVAGGMVTAHYTGAVAATGLIFESSFDSGAPVTFSLAGVIEGWQKGVPGMKVGGKRRLIIPAAMAYGANPPQNSGIPPGADLVFDIELVAVGQN